MTNDEKLLEFKWENDPHKALAQAINLIIDLLTAQDVRDFEKS